MEKFQRRSEGREGREKEWEMGKERLRDFIPN